MQDCQVVYNRKDIWKDIHSDDEGHLIVRSG